jgi:hypothetical protein
MILEARGTARWACTPYAAPTRGRRVLNVTRTQAPLPMSDTEAATWPLPYSPTQPLPVRERRTGSPTLTRTCVDDTSASAALAGWKAHVAECLAAHCGVRKLRWRQPRATCVRWLVVLSLTRCTSAARASKLAISRCCSLALAFARFAWKCKHPPRAPPASGSSVFVTFGDGATCQDPASNIGDPSGPPGPFGVGASHRRLTLFRIWNPIAQSPSENFVGARFP